LLKIKNAKLFLANPWLEFQLIFLILNGKEVIRLEIKNLFFVCQQPQRGPDAEKSKKAYALPVSFLESLEPLVAWRIETSAISRCRWCSYNCFWLSPEAVEKIISEAATPFQK